MENNNRKRRRDEDTAVSETVVLLSDEETTATTEKRTSQPSSSSHTIQCCVCMDELKNAVATPCGHILCSECLFEALATSHMGQRGSEIRGGLCPVCRQRVLYKDIVPLKVRFRKKV
ncbi:uncharacterized protein C5L36_0B12190 [Pichia kudriavzevii]|uniref:RING-type domain-containing protein n=1 Tax=Pichia kudriavzevii TaxID=4909 RepID=A0A2U9R3S6_PICKU|nr:uncharacterized protein C5L36_0B12190 [Pichia kudriavzevii]AWU75990.1 hypothetical protein C5L36_0B12190 [Pichia kudriavzevii]